MTNLNNSGGSTKARSIIVAIILIVFGVLVWKGVAPAQVVLSSMTLDDKTLETKSLKWAQVYGLQGIPVAKRSVYMTLDQWLAFSGGQLGPDMTQFGIEKSTPVYALAIRGNVLWSGFGSGLPSRSSIEQFDNITIVVDARNGNILSAQVKRDPSSMPVQVPFVELTPVPTIKFAPTLPLHIPPTLAPALTKIPDTFPSATRLPTLTFLRSPLPTPTRLVR